MGKRKSACKRTANTANKERKQHNSKTDGNKNEKTIAIIDDSILIAIYEEGMQTASE